MKTAMLPMLGIFVMLQLVPLTTAALGPDYASMMLCPKGMCIVEEKQLENFVGPQTSFFDCYDPESQERSEVVLWGPKSGETLESLLAVGYHEANMCETNEAKKEEERLWCPTSYCVTRLFPSDGDGSNHQRDWYCFDKTSKEYSKDVLRTTTWDGDLSGEDFHEEVCLEEWLSKQVYENREIEKVRQEYLCQNPLCLVLQKTDGKQHPTYACYNKDLKEYYTDIEHLKIVNEDEAFPIGYSSSMCPSDWLKGLDDESGSVVSLSEKKVICPSTDYCVASNPQYTEGSEENKQAFVCFNMITKAYDFTGEYSRLAEGGVDVDIAGYHSTMCEPLQSKRRGPVLTSAQAEENETKTSLRRKRSSEVDEKEMGVDQEAEIKENLDVEPPHKTSLRHERTSADLELDRKKSVDDQEDEANENLGDELPQEGELEGHPEVLERKRKGGAGAVGADP